MKRPKHIPEFSDIPTGRTKMPELGPDERRLNFREVELGFTEELARREAARCLSCRRCIGCGLCLAECDKCAVVYDEQAGEVSIQADAVVFATDADAFPAGRTRDLGYADCLNVITSLELDRLASPDGPFGGLVVRPSDGEIPKRVAFIQCVGSRDEAIGANYCSTECCSRTISQATRVREIIKDAEVQVFHRGLRPAGKTGEIDLTNLQEQAWVRLVEAKVAGVREDLATGAVTVRYAADGADGASAAGGGGGKESEAAFDLVVLAVGVQARRDFRRFARAGGVGVDKYGFVDFGVAGQIACKPGVAFAGTMRGPQPAAQAIADAVAGATRALGAAAAGAGSTADATTAAVVGGGVAGLAAAAELLRRGVKTVIVEKSDSVGSAFARLPAGRPGDPKTADDFVKSLEAHPDARLLTGAEVVSVERLSGAGGVRLVISVEARRETIDVGALVIATGAGPHIPRGWRAAADPVITQEHLASALAEGAAPWKRVAMLQCVGARDGEHPYCSRFCCRQALANALALKNAHPGVEVTILHRGIRVFGADEELYADALERGVNLLEIQGVPTMEEGEQFKVRAKGVGGEGLCLECDVVVLSVAASDNQEVRKVAAIAGAELDDLGFIAASDALADPFATRVPGVFVCGFARAPVTVEEAFADGVGAAGAVCSYLGRQWKVRGGDSRDGKGQEDERTRGGKEKRD